MESIIKILDFVEKNNDTISIFNIFLKLNNEYILIFSDLMNKFKNIKSYDEIHNLFTNITDDIKESISYIKCYNVIEKSKKINYIIFNPSVYEHINTDLYDNDIKCGIQIENITEIPTIRNKKLINYIIHEDNFIKKFIIKQNNKETFAYKAWNDSEVNSIKNKKINISLLNKKTSHETKIYSMTSNYKIKKTCSANLIINNELIQGSIRITLANIICICLIDKSYIYLNKIVISDTLNFGNICFPNIKSKFLYIKNIYETLFNKKIDEIKNISISISVKKNNINNLSYNSFVSYIQKNDITITKKNIGLKYIKNFEDLIKKYELCDEYYEKIKLFKKKLYSVIKESDTKLLYLTNEKLDKILL